MTSLWAQSRRSLCFLALAIIATPFLMIHILERHRADENFLSSFGPTSTQQRPEFHLRSLRSLRSPTSAAAAATTPLTPNNGDGGSRPTDTDQDQLDEDIGAIAGDRALKGKAKARAFGKRKGKKNVNADGQIHQIKPRFAFRSFVRLGKTKENNKPKKAKKPKKPKKPKQPKKESSASIKSFSATKCEAAEYVIQIEVEMLKNNKNIDKMIGSRLDGINVGGTHVWTAYCTDMLPSVGRNSQTIISIYGSWDFNNPPIQGNAGMVIKNLLSSPPFSNFIVIKEVFVLPIQSAPLQVRRTRRATLRYDSMLPSTYGKSNQRDGNDALEAANEEWRDLNIAALHHIISNDPSPDKPKPANNDKGKDDDDKKTLPYLSSQRSDFEILPIVCGTDLSMKQNAISIATQTDASPNRLARLVQMAERWDGYISVAIYGKKDDEDDLKRKVESFWHDQAKDLKDKVIIHLVIDARQEEEGYDDMHYPHNILRNIAIEHTPTDLVFYNDVDFIPSADSHAMLLKHLSSMPQDQPSVMVLPAFERKLFEDEIESQIITQDVPFSKANLLSQLDTNFERIAPFHENYASGHGPTDYAKWYRAAEPYEVEYDLDYEPYFVVDKKKWDVPLFWEHFTGFGKNKQSWVEELAVAGFRFYVCPDAFIVHIDHSVDDQDER